MANSKGKKASAKGGKAKAIKKLSVREVVLISIIMVLIIAILVILFGGYAKRGNENESGGGTENVDVVFSQTGNINLPPEFDGDVMEIHFIDIGQGDAIMCMLPDGKILMIDAGSGTRASVTTRTEYEEYLTDVLSVDKIEYMIITHPDSDHVNLAERVLEEYSVENIFFNEYYQSGSQTYKSFTDAAKSEGAELSEITDEYYENIEGDGYKISIYAPGNGGFEGADSATNSMSVMCLLEYGGRKVLFTGDAEVETEEWFMEVVQETDIDVLKVGHHGSDSCSSKEFIDFIDPEYAVISCGVRNTYRHPHANTMQTLFEAGVVTYRTDRHGDIVLYIDEDGDFGFLPENDVPVDNNSLGRNPLTLKRAA